MLQFAEMNHLFITNTKFQHRKKHLLTWYSNDGRTASQIDYILISRRWFTSVLDSRAIVNAETGNEFGSDHVMVRARIRLHLQSQRRSRRLKKLNIKLTEDADMRENLNRAIETRFDQLGVTTNNEESSSSEEKWQKFKSKIYSASISNLGTNVKIRKDWISTKTINLAQQTTSARANSLPTYRKFRRQTSRSARIDRNAYWEEIASSMEQAASVGDTRKLYQLIRTQSHS